MSFHNLDYFPTMFKNNVPIHKLCSLMCTRNKQLLRSLAECVIRAQKLSTSTPAYNGVW